MKTWFIYLKQGLSRTLPVDAIAGTHGYGSTPANLRNLYPYIKSHGREVFVGLLLVLMASLFAFPPPLITRYLIDEVILGRRAEYLIVAVLLLVCILGAEKLMRVSEEFYFARFEQRLILAIHADLIARVLRLPKGFFDDKQTGYLMKRLSEDVDGLRWFFSSSIVHIIGNIIRFIGGIGFLFYLEWRLSIAVLMLLPGLGWCIRYFSDKIQTLSHQCMEQKAQAAGRFQESLSEATLIKSFTSEDRTQSRLVSALKSIFQISLEQTTVVSLAHLTIDSMPGMSRAIVLAIGAFWVINAQWTLGSLLAYQAFLAYVFGPVQFLAAANLRLQEALAALKRVSAFFGIVPEENLQTGKKVTHLSGAIEFKNVSFAYNGHNSVLKNVSFRIEPGERVAIVGPSGVGKTTLLSLILRFYQPTSGEIYFDGRAASEYDLSSLRRRIGYVSQQPRLLAGTIAENLRYGSPDADWEQVMQAVRISGIHEFIERLPHGYHTQVGENGIKLSEGQKQRLAITRALIKDPDILVLDEPAAALDSRAETSLFDALPQMVRQKTMFVVTHRASTIRHVNRILVLDENRFIAIGAHRALIDSNQYYREMIASQQPRVNKASHFIDDSQFLPSDSEPSAASKPWPAGAFE